MNHLCEEMQLFVPEHACQCAAVFTPGGGVGGGRVEAVRHKKLDYTICREMDELCC